MKNEVKKVVLAYSGGA
ncbi:hypothetical protein H730_04210 [Campylobacter jejuni subsp. jejuni R14]|nr:hypothetical protein H730_04210 [Campylobacter jejuni subsp. jejuni R14]